MQWRRWKQPKKKLRKRQIQNLGPFWPPWWSSWCHAALFSHSPGTSGKRAALPRRRRNEGTNWTRQKVSLGPRCCEDSNTWSHVWITANDLFGKTIFEKKHVSKSFQPFVSLLSIFLLIQPRGFDSTWNSCIRSSFTQQGGRIGVLMMEANHQKGLVLILIHWFQWWSSLKVISCCLALSEIHCSIRFDLARKRKRPMQLPAASPNFWAQEWIFAVRIFLDYQHRCHHNSSLVQEDVNVFQDFGKEPKLFRVTSEAVQKSLAFRLILALQVIGAWWCSDPRGQGQWNGSSPSFSTHLWNPSLVTLSGLETPGPQVFYKLNYERYWQHLWLHVVIARSVSLFLLGLLYCVQTLFNNDMVFLSKKMSTVCAQVW